MSPATTTLTSSPPPLLPPARPLPTVYLRAAKDVALEFH